MLPLFHRDVLPQDIYQHLHWNNAYCFHLHLSQNLHMPYPDQTLGQHGVNIVEFTKQFNAKTADQGDMIIPVVITVYNDRSFSFITKTPPAAVLIKKACNIKSGSGVPNKNKVATITKAQVEEIAKTKMPDLNAATVEAAASMIAGTCRSMGVTVVD